MVEHWGIGTGASLLVFLAELFFFLIEACKIRPSEVVTAHNLFSCCSLDGKLGHTLPAGRSWLVMQSDCRDEGR